MAWVNDRPLKFHKPDTRRFTDLIKSVYGNHVHLPALYAVAAKADVNTGAIAQGGPAFVPRQVMIAATSQGKLLPFIAEIVCDEFSEGIHEEIWELLDTNAAKKVQSIILNHEPSFHRKARLADGIIYEINGEAQGSNFERILNEFALFHNPMEFRYKLAESEAKVVRVDIDDIGQGTGFLVGPDLVLTNYHVIEPAIENLSRVTVLCDYKFVPKNEGMLLSKGRTIRLAENGLLAQSNHNPVEDELSQTGAEQHNPPLLDFALIRLSEPIGSQGLGETGEGDEQRGWYKLPIASHSFQPTAGLFILGHPQLEGDADAGALKLTLSMPCSAELISNGQRLRHGVNTEGGNSGSPILNQTFLPVALHHAGFDGQPDWAPEGIWEKGFNQAIPLNLIAEEIQRQIGDESVLNSLGLSV